MHSINTEVKVAMEATGHYHYPVRNTFLNEGIFVALINPYIMKKYGESTIRKGKTDKKDAIRIATYILENHINYSHIQQPQRNMMI